VATGDTNDFLARLKAVLARRWFASSVPGADSSTPVLDGVLTAPASVASWLYDLLEYVAGQRRVATATDINLDMIANDFFGLALPRRAGEQDNAYRARIAANLLAQKDTRAAVIQAVTTLTGIAPAIFEPARPADTGGYGHLGMTKGTGLGYGVAGGYGSLSLPFQAFVKAYRPHGGGIANSQGYYSLANGGGAIGGYGVGLLQYASMNMIRGVVSDDDIMATIAATAPAATILWCNVGNAPGLPPQKPGTILATLFEIQQSQGVSAHAFGGLPSATLTEVQQDQTLAAAAITGSVRGALAVLQAGQTVSGVIQAAAIWSPTDKANVTLSNANLTASTSAVAQAGIRSTNGLTGGLGYVELTLTSALAGEGYGIATPTWSETDVNGIGGDLNSIGVGPGGDVYMNNAFLGYANAVAAAGHVLCMAVNANTKQIWFRTDDNPWGIGTGFVQGTASAGTSGAGPVISGPASGTVTVGIALGVSGCTVADSIWPTASGTGTMLVWCDTGTLSMSNNGTAVSGSSISLDDTGTNLAAALGTLSYLAPASVGTDTITISVYDQYGQNSQLSIPITIQAADDPVAGIGGFSFAGISAGPLMIAFGSNVAGSSVTVNFGAAPFQFPVPAGYEAWAIGVPPSAPIVTTSAETSSSITLNWTPSS
jgi:hypothetical protein